MGKPRKRLRKRLRKRIRKRTWLRKDLRWALVLNEEQDIISVYSMRFERVLKNQQVLSRSFPCPRGRNPVCVCVCVCVRGVFILITYKTRQRLHSKFIKKSER